MILIIDIEGLYFVPNGQFISVNIQIKKYTQKYGACLKYRKYSISSSYYHLVYPEVDFIIILQTVFQTNIKMNGKRRHVVSL